MDGVASERARRREVKRVSDQPIRAYRFCSRTARCCGCACAWGSLVAIFTTGGSPCAILGTIRVSRGGRPRSEKPAQNRAQTPSNSMRLEMRSHHLGPILHIPRNLGMVVT